MVPIKFIEAVTKNSIFTIMLLRLPKIQPTDMHKMTGVLQRELTSTTKRCCACHKGKGSKRPAQAPLAL